MSEVKYNRILLKLSGEALKGNCSDPLDASCLASAARQVKRLHDAGVEVGIVVGGGNIFRARTAGKIERNRADHMGMLATMINSLALADALEKIGVEAEVLSAVDMDRFCDAFSVRRAKASLSSGRVVLFACGSGSPFFTTDTAAALRACEIGADALMLAKNVDALYDSNPDTNKDAKPLPHPTYSEVIAMSLGGMDITAVTLCKEQSMPIVIFKLTDASDDTILNAACAKNIGTLIDS